MIILEYLRKILFHNYFTMLGIIFLTIIIFIPVSKISIAFQEVQAANALSIESKASKNISKKFCNSLGFGLSDESAMRFALGENSQENTNNAITGSTNPRDLISSIESDIMEKCGYLIGSSDNLKRGEIEEMINNLKS
ncbi:Hypothetical protein P9211_08121 [Prochlorococcus marinus str. MIT 9211]|uniref:Uncharacterized protein n=2 Tax=Prochlorococcus marinus TaxID=1219 RepID=A9BA81_PROM4|nr:Hypothetical protein P9211_08121 [Prochlorococcus marinus str. MIT 9211]